MTEKRNKPGIIYKITNLINGLSYIGLTTRTLEERWEDHLYCSRQEKEESRFYRSIRKYGAENFKREVIDRAESEVELEQKEIEWIAKLNTLHPGGYNVSRGGNNPPHGEESSIKRIKSLTGRKLSPEHVEKMRIGNIGKHPPLSPEKQAERSRKMSESRKGKYAGINSPFYGKKRSKEILIKISKTTTGRKRPEKDKDKIKRTCSDPEWKKAHSERIRAGLARTSKRSRPWLGKKRPEEITRKIIETKRRKRLEKC